MTRSLLTAWILSSLALATAAAGCRGKQVAKSPATAPAAETEPGTGAAAAPDGEEREPAADEDGASDPCLGGE